VKGEKIRSFDVCDEDADTDPDQWYVIVRMGESDWQSYGELLLEPDPNFPEYLIRHRPDGFPRRTCCGVLRVVTDRGTYVAPLDAPSTEGDWRQKATLIGLWPRLRTQKIERIIFCKENTWAAIDDWPGWEVPQTDIPQCIGLLDRAMQAADPNNYAEPLTYCPGRIKIITDKAKYLVPAEASTRDVYGNEWTSRELGMFLRECGFAYPRAGIQP